MKKPAKAKSPPELLTLRDFLRFAVSRFNEAGLAYGHGTTNALDEAAFLILETLHLPIDQLDPFLDARLTGDEREELARIIEARINTRKPAAYLTGRAYIQGVPFRVDERVIVPRSFIGEILFSEMVGGDGFSLVEDPEAVESVLDLCTGSGSLAIIAALRFPNATVDGTDISADALSVAAENVADHGLERRIRLFQGDLFAPLKTRSYDLILANPPYVAADEMAGLPPEYRHEPELALAAGEDGLDIVRRIISEAPGHLNEGGALLCEIGTGRDAVEADYPDLDLFWVDTEESSGEVFWATREALAAVKRPAKRKRQAASSR